MSDHDQVHNHEHSHGHGNEHDQGVAAMLRYARHAREMWTSQVNAAVVAQLAPTRNEHLADIGAGVGAGAVVAAERAGQVFAIEPTNYVRRILSMRSRLSANPFAIVDGSAEATGLPADSMHVIMAVNTMHHWVDVDAACVELARVRRPGGRMLLIDEDFDDPAHPDYERWSAQHEDGDHTHHFHMVDTEAIANKLEEVGISVSFHGKRPIVGRPAWVVETSTI